MQIAICDDEQAAREMLAEQIEKLIPDVELACYQSGEELLAASGEPDIVFLDIEMQGINGMETARELRKMHKRTVLIFVTAWEDFVFQAFDVGAFHYLVKPFKEQKLAQIVKKAMEQIREQRTKEEEIPSGLLITTGGKHITVYWKDIIYAEVFNRKIVIHTLDSDIEYYGKLKELEKEAGEAFYRSHRAYLINFRYVKKYDAGTIWLERGQALIAKQNYRDFVRCYLRYIRREEGR